MPVCPVYGCCNRTTSKNRRSDLKKKKNLHWFSFPADEVRKKAWIQEIRRDNWMPTNTTRICSEHFHSDSFYRTPKGLLYLKKDSVPSIFPSYPTYFQKEESKGDSDHINLKVLGNDNTIVQFKIKKHTPLAKLMKAYCERVGFAMAAVRFRFDGTPIRETDTPTSLEMEEGDTIEVYQQQTGG